MPRKHQSAEPPTKRQLLVRLIAGTLLSLIAVFPTYLAPFKPEWLAWLIRAFAGLWWIDWWRCHGPRLLSGWVASKSRNRNNPQI